MPALCAFAQVEIFMINPLNVHISEVLKKKKKPEKKKKRGKKEYCPDDAKRTMHN